ncbi:DUF3574 domain-containing protein [Rosenbergiella nectarea]|uniref:DUF3574 domain-containing protein n=1 Tax=Rosenbergiella nectarea TaxID=988801 RepID=UPI001BDB4A67|nr:DUF3574 domain-containing protein [Rosenbergiella nectarea]MBT0730766.1 DUF3574 domain-containing protein [Rosenbergiella nectarea subsp. apis]
MKVSVYSLLLTSGLLLAGCQPRQPDIVPCQVGSAMQQTQLWFGLSRPDGQSISTQQWQHFVDQVITPVFPQGLSIVEAKGQWLGNNGERVSENSRGLLLIYPASKEKSQAIDLIRTRYRQLFAQESVMRIDQPVCVAF